MAYKKDMPIDYAVAFRSPKHPSIYLEAPLTASGALVTSGVARVAHGGLGEQCPGCGGDLAETWTLTPQDGGDAPYIGSAVRAECDCGFREVGALEAWDS